MLFRSTNGEDGGFEVPAVEDEASDGSGRHERKEMAGGEADGGDLVVG